jgi:hypothetical protein
MAGFEVIIEAKENHTSQSLSDHSNCEPANQHSRAIQFTQD